MKIIIIGAGASGVTAAINLKRRNPDDDILIIERLDKPLKKLLATGNGKCNLGNAKLNCDLFNNPNFVRNTITNYNYEEFFDSISIKTKLIGDLAYPVSESAVSVRDALLNECRKLKIKINVNENLLDYKIKDNIEVVTDVRNYSADKLILAGGLFSSPKLGSNGSVCEILKNHNYKVSDLYPGLSPLVTKEKTKELDGVRCKANVKLFVNNKLVHEEPGEVLFKEHGLSGIVIFNIMSLIARNGCKNSKIQLDLLPDYSDEYLENYKMNHTIDECLLAFINPKISAYLKTRFAPNFDLIKNTKYLDFTFDKSMGYDFSQVTVGGIEIDQINKNFMSKIENNVYIIGELLNVDGPCGGYNLTFAFASALKIK